MCWGLKDSSYLGRQEKREKRSGGETTRSGRTSRKLGWCGTVYKSCGDGNGKGVDPIAEGGQKTCSTGRTESKEEAFTVVEVVLKKAV